MSGNELQVIDSILGGHVTRYFDEYDKAQFVEDWCAERGFTLAQVRGGRRLALGRSVVWSS